MTSQHDLITAFLQICYQGVNGGSSGNPQSYQKQEHKQSADEKPDEQDLKKEATGGEFDFNFGQQQPQKSPAKPVEKVADLDDLFGHQSSSGQTGLSENKNAEDFFNDSNPLNFNNNSAPQQPPP